MFGNGQYGNGQYGNGQYGSGQSGSGQSGGGQYGGGQQAPYDGSTQPAQVSPSGSGGGAGPGGAAGGSSGADGGTADLDAQLDEITKGASDEAAQVGVAVGAAADVASMIVDPFGSLLSAGVGWLLDNISFLREPLDALLGDPQAIAANSDQLSQISVEIQTIAQEHDSDVGQLQDWQGPAADACKGSMSRLTGELVTLSKAVKGAELVVSVSGDLVSALRDVVRDLISQLLSDLIMEGLAALAAAAFTFGASIPAFIGAAVGQAAALAAKCAAKIAKLVAALGRNAGRFAKVIEVMEKIAKILGRFAAAVGVVTALPGAVNGIANGIDNLNSLATGSSSSGTIPSGQNVPAMRTPVASDGSSLTAQQSVSGPQGAPVPPARSAPIEWPPEHQNTKNLY
ncbi:hypothetical protein F0L68_24385 [Solihabitans fulvus]|uniref:Proteins of 100 residues with WXG n=2 Tax=Solihabitans fulvus TaxID=1892852 RepID=A0A5B2X4D8_9PSEU|nr:hypothetical protein F0L68_24385 [Solihabitans fulvus]